MKRVQVSRFFSIFSFFVSLISPFQLPAVIEPLRVSDVEQLCIPKNSEESYVCLDKSLSPFFDVICEISELDNNIDSPIHVLRKYLEDGFVVGLNDDIVEVMIYAESFLKHQKESAEKYELTKKLDSVIEHMYRRINIVI